MSENASAASRPAARLYRVIQPVGDIERAAAVYGELLGMNGTRVSPGRHYFDCGGTILACYDSRADGDGPADPPRYHAEQFIYFSVPDLEATYLAAIRLGFKDRNGGIQSMPWGERMFWTTDPFGNPVSFVAAGTEFLGPTDAA
jgi:catechol 2,3-dioxygenase-like lactoylglutathione lyase family enzyme